jgi:ribonucleoside-diphosphate reductase alpha chain
VFLKLSKQGSILAGVRGPFSMAISISLQYGGPLETYVAKFTNMKFFVCGLTDDPDIGYNIVIWTESRATGG